MDWTDLLTFIGAWFFIGITFAAIWGVANWFGPGPRELSPDEWEAWAELEVEYEDIPEQEIV